MRINYSIILVSDMVRSVAFYRDIVGMPLKFETPSWTEFDTDGATWALHISDGPARKSGMGQIPEQREAVQLHWRLPISFRMQLPGC